LQSWRGRVFTPVSDAFFVLDECPHCGGTKFEKETDIFDVWLNRVRSYRRGRRGNRHIRGRPTSILEAGAVNRRMVSVSLSAPWELTNLPIEGCYSLEHSTKGPGDAGSARPTPGSSHPIPSQTSKMSVSFSNFVRRNADTCPSTKNAVGLRREPASAPALAKSSTTFRFTAWSLSGLPQLSTEHRNRHAHTRWREIHQSGRV